MSSILDDGEVDSDWRKLAKKLRRKRIRQEEAAARCKAESRVSELEARNRSPSYIAALDEQERAEEFRLEEETRISKRNEIEWMCREEEAQRLFQELQVKLALAREERVKQNARIKQEWDAEQKRLKDLKEQKEKQEEEKRLQLERLQQRIEDYIEYGGDIPEQLLAPLPSNPNKEICPFFKKTGTCRFGDNCSRNHVRPGVSKIILIPSFYSHYSLEQSSESEYGNDVSLEFENHEMQNHFKDFFHDVLPEMMKCGTIRQFKVCCNQEPHLRGNVYVEYSNYREAMKSFKLFQGRWYGGKQLNVEFSTITSWKSAICGLYFKQRCPKGSTCNFLHVFRNPCDLFYNADKDLHRTPPLNDFETSENPRNWRWSESPEPMDPSENGNRHKYHQKQEYNSSRRYRHNGHNSSKREKRRSRSRSRTRKRRRSRLSSPCRKRTTSNISTASEKSASRLISSSQKLNFSSDKPTSASQ